MSFKMRLLHCLPKRTTRKTLTRMSRRLFLNQKHYKNSSKLHVLIQSSIFERGEPGYSFGSSSSYNNWEKQSLTPPFGGLSKDSLLRLEVWTRYIPPFYQGLKKTIRSGSEKSFAGLFSQKHS